MHNNKTITHLYWRDVKDKIISLNPFIGNAINQVSGVDDFRVIVAKYPFGSTIVDQGNFHLQIDNHNVPLSDPSIPSIIGNLLDYPWQVMPFGMMLENSIETFHALPTHIIPYRLYYPGRTFSLLSIFNDSNCSHLLPESYSSVAGCRSLITLPQVAHKQYHQRLSKRLNLDKPYIAKTFSDQWSLFKAISQSESFTYPWHAEIVFFSKDFIGAMDQHPALKNSLLNSIWQNTAFARNQDIHDLVWSAFIEAEVALSVKNNLIVMETVKYLLKMMMQARPGYAPVTNNIAGPIRGLSKMLLDIYRIRFYLPVFMQVEHYDGQQPLYYSLQKPCFVHAISHKCSDSQTINLIKLVQQTFEHFKSCVLNNTLPFSLTNTRLHQCLLETELDFFHPKGTSNLRNDIDTLFADDLRFHQVSQQLQHYNQLSLPDSSMFFHGCIRMRPKTKYN